MKTIPLAILGVVSLTQAALLNAEAEIEALVAVDAELACQADAEAQYYGGYGRCCGYGGYGGGYGGYGGYGGCGGCC
jgi:hypothetical protein